MSLNAKNVAMSGGGDKKVDEQDALDAATYPARIVSIIDLGLQPQRPYKGTEKPPKQEILITYEMLDEFCVDKDGEEMEDKPRWVSESIPFNNLEVDLATSTKRYKALDPDMELDGDFTKLIDMPCAITLTKSEGKGKNSGRWFNNVSSISKMRGKDARKAPPLIGTAKFFSCSDPDLEVFRSLYEYQQKRIKDNLEYNGSILQTLLEGGESENPKPEQDVPAPKSKGRIEPVEEEDDEW